MCISWDMQLAAYATRARDENQVIPWFPAGFLADFWWPWAPGDQGAPCLKLLVLWSFNCYAYSWLCTPSASSWKLGNSMPHFQTKAQCKAATKMFHIKWNIFVAHLPLYRMMNVFIGWPSGMLLLCDKCSNAVNITINASHTINATFDSDPREHVMFHICSIVLLQVKLSKL